jgi:16S rRNA (guanine(527)-N(7))-methyltransferase RsmG
LTAVGVAAAGAHGPSLAALGLPGDAGAALARYLDLLSAWSTRINLTAARTPEERVAVLVAPVVPMAAGLERGMVIDVGSGNGSPGLVLGLLRPDLAVTLLEPRQKRWAFLREAARAAGRPDIEVLRSRHDAYPGPAAQTVVLRALALSLEDVVPLVKPGGRVLVWGPRPTDSLAYAEEPTGMAGVHSFRRR